MSEYGLTRLKGDAEPKRTRVPTAPIAALSRLTATSASVDMVEVAAMPPPSTRPAFALARSRATCLIVSAGTPEAVAAASTSAARTAARRVERSAPGACRPSSRITLSIASASAPSVPGALRSHSSALAAVRDMRGSTCTNVPCLPWKKACIRAKSAVYPSLLSHVSRKSAPKETR